MFLVYSACAMVMRRDFEYWGLDELDLEPCCALKFYPNIEICNTQIEGDIEDKMKEEQEKLAEDFGDDKLGQIRSKVWDLIEKPWTSTAAQYYAVMSMAVVVVSTATFVFSTLESEDEEESHPYVLLAIEIIGKGK